MIKPTLTKDTLSRFELWRGFLLQSASYKKLCSFVEKKKQAYPWNDPIIRLWSPAKKDFDRPYFNWLRSSLTGAELDQIYDEKTGTTYKTILEELYPLFQNIHLNDFSDVENRVRLFYTHANFESISIVSPALDTILELLYSHPMYHSTRSSEHVCAFELIESIADHLRDNIDNFNLISINHNNLGFGEGQILAEIKHYLKPYDYKAFHPKEVPPRWGIFLASNPFSIPTMEARLEAYQTKHMGISRKEAITRTFPMDSRDEKTQENNYDTFVRQAAKIIKNAELGSFPGEYGK